MKTDEVKSTPGFSAEGTTGARARASTEEVDRRIEIVGREVAEGRWGPKRTRELAREFGVHERAVRGYATQAWRLIEMATIDASGLHVVE